VELRLRDLRQWRKFAAACIRKQDVDMTLHRGDARVDAIKVGRIRDIAADGFSAVPDDVRGGVQLGLPSASDIDHGALAREPLRRRESDPGAAARYQYDLPGMFDDMGISIL
jgi:hypothetical protein